MKFLQLRTFISSSSKRFKSAMKDYDTSFYTLDKINPNEKVNMNQWNDSFIF